MPVNLRFEVHDHLAVPFAGRLLRGVPDDVERLLVPQHGFRDLVWPADDVDVNAHALTAVFR
jgi:hypothetical protein